MPLPPLRFSAAFSLRSFAPRGLLLFTLMMLAALTDGIGIMLLVPMLAMLSGDSTDTGPLKQVWAWLSDLGLPDTAGGLIVVFLVLVVMRSTIQLSRDRLSARLQHEIVDTLRMACFTALLNVEWRWLIKSRKSDQANLLLNDVSRVGLGLQYSISLLVSLLTILTYLGTAFALSWEMTLVAVGSGGLLFGVISRQSRAAHRMGQMMGKANQALHATVQDALAGIKLTKILGNASRHLVRLRETLADVRQQQVRFMGSTALSRAFFQIGGAVLLGAYLYAGLSYWQTPAPELLTLIFIFSRLTPLLMTAQQQFHHCMHALPAFKETQNLLNACRVAAEPQPMTLTVVPLNTALVLDKVCVRYAGRDALALENITLNIPARSTTAIIGHSGAGKSTLADVIMGLLVPDAGEMRIDDQVASGGNRIHWRHSVAYVPQEVFLFHDTIRNNLLWGNPQANDTALHEALRLAAADFVAQLPQGIDTVVGDAGLRLSGGERQRIALARALLHRPSLLILDEATSALDVENEARIRDAIEGLHGDLTVIIIGHRLMTLEHADQVIKMAHGRIEKMGTWQEINA